MEGELWSQLYRLVMNVAQDYPRKKNVVYTDPWILLVYLWSVLHDRPQGWACDPAHWSDKALDARELPSQSQLSVRLRTLSLRQLAEAVLSEARSWMPVSMVKHLDAKPLAVGSWSKDPDTRWGQAGQAKAKGYKLFAIYDGAGVDAWRIGPMSESEPTVAQQLIPRTAARAAGYVLADSLYDSNPLHKTCREHGLQLVAPRKRPGTGLGHRPHDPSRLRSIELLEAPGDFGRQLYGRRVTIEQRFAQAGNLACGLGPLPNWVRRPHRVALWVAGKLMILACWNDAKQRLAA